MLDPARLADGQPPMRVGEVAAAIGFSVRFVQKLLEADVLTYVYAPRVAGPTDREPERRVPVYEVRRLVRQLGVAVEGRKTQAAPSE